jgi:hypothetical protein
MRDLADYFVNVVLSIMSALAFALVVYNCIHPDGGAWFALSCIAFLGFSVGSLIFWNKNTQP